uniref:Centrosomal protein 170B n=1 Tax=Stegastes partitus TaxID=144197 RepID=A0A3B5B2B7_9TELE
MSVTSWFLVSSSGTRHRLPREMIFVGRDDCELMLQSRSVDKQHAVINYDTNTDEHMVKDLGSLNGTFVNDLRIPDQTYITLKLSDVIRFGYDILFVYLSFQIVLRYSPISKPTPLYGQPSWWGEDEDPANKKQSRDASRYEVNGSLSDSQAKSIFSYRREPSYFEIPTKEFQQRPTKKLDSQVHEVPTKDTPDPTQCVSSTPTPPVVQSHASFTIEFDDCTPGRMKIKDHVTKFSFRQQRKHSSIELATTPTEMLSAESKVADWLVQSNASMMRRSSQGEDLYSTNSDPSLMLSTKANHHEDGSHSDSGHPTISRQDFLQSGPQNVSQGSPQTLRNSPPQRFPHQAFVIEFFDDNPRKKRSQSFTNNTTPPESSERQVPPPPTTTPPTQRYTIPLKSPAPTGPQRAGSLRREKTEDRISTGFSSRSSSSVSTRPFSSVGRRSKLAQEFTAEFLKQSDQSTTSPPQADGPYPPQTSSPIHKPVPLKAPVMPLASPTVEVKSPHGGPRNEEEDSLSDAGTYTIETEAQDKELEDARSKIDQASCLISFIFNLSTVRSSRGFNLTILNKLCFFPMQVQSAGAVLQGAPKWMSCWASLADSYTESGPSSGLFDIPPQMELSGGARRILPQVPPGDKCDIPTPSIHVHYDPHSTFDVGNGSLVAPSSQDSIHRLTVQDDVEPDSLSDASKSDDGSIIEQRRRPVPAKSTQEFGKVKPTVSAPVLGQGTRSPELKEGSPLIRQESFTKERPSNARLPNISSQPLQRDPDPELFQGANSQDTHSFLKETEDVLAVLEAKLQAGRSGPTPSPIMDSLSGESDVDTSSTVSQHSNKTKPNTLTKKTSASGFHRERSSASIASQDSNHQSTSSEKHRSLGSDSRNKTESVRRPVGLRRSVGKCGSTDLSDDPQSLPFSDQESNNHQTRKKYTVPLQKEDGKTTRVSQALSRANSLSAPRPTRASMLRRARLGEASDNEGTETDRLSQEAANAPPKQPQEAKKLSRLDMLAMPRKRTSSFNTPSDTEASSTPQWTGRSSGFSNRSTESGSSSTRRASASGPKPAERPQKAALGKTPITRGRSSSAKYASSTASSRRRQKGSDYTSTSDEEYDSNQSTPKHKRSQPSPASYSPRHQPRSLPVVAMRPKSRNRDSEDENHEGEAFQNWSSHSAEIARLSQDLAKDLAILAREIHDVATDGEPQNPGEEGSAPVSTVTAHEQLVQHIPEAGLHYQRVPPSSARTREPDQSSSDLEQHSRQRAPSRDEAVVDNLMLNPVSQVIVAIRENTEQLADKIKVLFQDRVDIWEEIEAKVNSENDIPVVKTSNKEITTILKELRRVQRQLEVINTVMEPSGQPEATKTSSSSSSSGARSSRPASSRDWRTIHSVTKRGGGPRPSESVRRAAVTPDDLREGYLV